MKKLFILPTLITLTLFSFLNSCYPSQNAPVTGTITVQGVPTVIISDGDIKGFYADCFKSYTVGTGNTYVYNDSGGTSSTAGALRIQGMTSRTLEIQITNMGDAGTNTIGIFGANGTTTPTVWGLIYEASYNGTVTSSGTQTGSINISEPHDYIRMGVRRSGTSGADFTVSGSFYRNK